MSITKVLLEPSTTYIAFYQKAYEELKKYLSHVSIMLKFEWENNYIFIYKTPINTYEVVYKSNNLPQNIDETAYKTLKQRSISCIKALNKKDISTLMYDLSYQLQYDLVVILDPEHYPLVIKYLENNHKVVLSSNLHKMKLENRHIIVVTDSLIYNEGVSKVYDYINTVGGHFVSCLSYEKTTEEVKFPCRFHIIDDMRWQDVEELGAAPSNTVNNYYSIYPPSLETYIRDPSEAVLVNWGKFYRSSNIWFDASKIKNNTIRVFIDPANAEETYDTLQLLSILYRKDPKKIIVVIPFLEQSTQDRVEYKDKQQLESLAAVDTIAKLIGNYTVYTFDLHAEQSRFAFYDLRYFNLIEYLLEKYFSDVGESIIVYPDDGAAKRYSKKSQNYITFRKVRDGEARIICTDAEIKENASYVIVDDLVRSGGTMNEVAKYLLARKAASVDAVFTHAPFEAKAARNLSIFRFIYTSDTCIRNVRDSWIKVRIVDYLNNYAN